MYIYVERICFPTFSQGEWVGKSAGGSRNHPSWVRNPLYTLRTNRDAMLHVFLRQVMIYIYLFICLYICIYREREVDR